MWSLWLGFSERHLHHPMISGEIQLTAMNYVLIVLQMEAGLYLLEFILNILAKWTFNQGIFTGYPSI